MATKPKLGGEINAMSPQVKRIFRSDAGGIEKVQHSLSKLFTGGFCDPHHRKPNAKDSPSMGTTTWIIDNDWNDTSPRKPSDRSPMGITDVTGRKIPLISPISSTPRESRSSEFSASLEVTKKQLFPPEMNAPPNEKGHGWVEKGFIFVAFAAFCVYCMNLSNIEVAIEKTTLTESSGSTKSIISNAIPFLETCPAPNPGRNSLLDSSEERYTTKNPSPFQKGKSTQLPRQQYPQLLSNTWQLASEAVQWLIPLILTFVVSIWIVLSMVLRQAAPFTVDKHD